MAFGAAVQRERSIPGAVATLGVSDRVAFLRKTYAHLGAALILWALMTAGIFVYAPSFSMSVTRTFLGTGGYLLIMIAFVAVKSIASALARSESSRGLQYVGLFLSPLAEAVILQPLIWLTFFKFAHSTTTSPGAILGQAALVTVLIFAGLTATVFITKKDFTFLRGFLMVGTFAALGIIIASLIFGFSLGMVFVVAMIVLMAGYILYQTTLVMSHFPPTQHVSAALMLYSSIATLFWYVLQIFLSSRR
jgi:FtsH-binding integral membrane protein